ncbi:MAG: 16S rRNA (uracil(1498)-N(3))-methyltransferase [Balneolaceae bacterium]|nr:16S rRNA (uracil(1498)-N(3))-methyltransferase [Balneolaceae bacterium]
MNVFYTESDHGIQQQFYLEGQEARHAAKALRLREGDEVYATDGKGRRLKGTVTAISKQRVVASTTEIEEIPRPSPGITLAMGIIKKRDRLEFAVEKAVELGVSEIALFVSDHTIKTNVREDRLHNIVLSAVKQSLRVWLPQVNIYDALDNVLAEYNQHHKLMAHEKTTQSFQNKMRTEDELLLMVGPEGGFSDREVQLAGEAGSELVSLGKYRLRAETAAVTFLARILS